MSGYFAELERELTRAAVRQQRSSRRKRTTAIVAAAIMILAVPTGAAVTTVFEPHKEGDGLVRLTEPRVIAEGSTSSAGRWRLIASESSAGFCLGIELASTAPGARPEGCGGVRAGSLGLSAASANGTIWLAYGPAPEQSETVTIVSRGRPSVTLKTTNDGVGLAGRFYVAEMPDRPAFGSMRVVARDPRGKVLAEVHP